jgi:F0F1-type ATP synthase assembly protein I
MNRKLPPDNKKFFLRYASLGSQLLAAIGIAVFAGLSADKWLRTSPLLACALPLLVLSAIFYKLFKETNRTNRNE